MWYAYAAATVVGTLAACIEAGYCIASSGLLYLYHCPAVVGIQVGGYCCAIGFAGVLVRDGRRGTMEFKVSFFGSELGDMADCCLACCQDLDCGLFPC